MDSTYFSTERSLYERAITALIAAVTLPLWWPLIIVFFILIWAFLTLALAFICVCCVALPVMIVVGVPPDTHTELEVKVPIDQVEEAKELLATVGAKVTNERTTSG